MGKHQSDELDTRRKTLAEQINEARDRREKSATATIKHAARVGELLLTAKRFVAHGAFGPWLQDNCSLSQRQAQRYMQVAMNRHLLEQNGGPSTIRGMLHALTHERQQHTEGQDDDSGIAAEEVAEEDEPKDEDEGITEVEPEDEDEDEDEGIEEERPEEELPLPLPEHEKHELRRMRLPRLLGGQGLTDRERKVLVAVNKNVGCFVRDIAKAAMKHGKRLSKKKLGKDADVDDKLMAMVLISLAMEVLDPLEVFAPQQEKDD